MVDPCDGALDSTNERGLMAGRCLCHPVVKASTSKDCGAGHVPPTLNPVRSDRLPEVENRRHEGQYCPAMAPIQIVHPRRGPYSTTHTKVCRRGRRHPCAAERGWEDGGLCVGGTGAWSMTKCSKQVGGDQNDSFTSGA